MSPDRFEAGRFRRATFEPAGRRRPYRTHSESLTSIYGSIRQLFSRRALAEERGVALIEFTLVLPVLLLLLFGMVDLGKAFNYWMDETQLASEGARWAVVNKNPASSGSLQEYIRSEANSDELRDGDTDSVPDALSVCISFPKGTSAVGDPVEVEVRTTYNFMPFLGGVSKTVKATAVMRLEQVPTNYSEGGSCT